MILPLETFRGIFALIIVLHHLKIDTFIQNFRIILNGGLVVDFFFVLSGFVISLNYLDKIKSKIDLINFQKKRFLRLYPLHILTLFVFIIIELIKLYVNNYTGLQTRYEPFSDFNNFYSLFANFFLLHGWYGWSFNLPSWSISTEFYTYLIFGLIVLFSRYRVISFIIFIILSLSILILNNFGLENLEKFVYPSRCIYSFFLGAITYQFYKKFKNSSTLISIVLVIFSIIFIHSSDYFLLNNKYILAPLIFSFTIYFISNLNHETLFYKMLANKFTVYLGSISYGVYMIHFALVWFFRQFSRFYLNIPSNGEYLVFNNYYGEILTILFLMFVIGISHLSLKYFESRFR